ncbi:hypothetical protein DZC78_10445 [Olleya aquimaris]|uniref:O-antigen ligase-like membrane protein n=1 Tax=Olleya sediminilitoris TaxID=2795739 RepID=A0ABS1WHC1_9FLAO|nr:hypothetical protein [Olleya sediminilitoris]AXO80786.1 hypothetical protein DZC78_10445 [Olleya aquimaris]MBL7558514.1 hypothetical protein [Olleya sediminilitoris]
MGKITDKIYNKNFLLKNSLLFFFTYDFIIKLFVSYDIANLTYYRYGIVFKILIIISAYISYNQYKVDYKFLTPIILLSISFLVSQLSFSSTLNQANILFNGHYFLNSVFALLFVYMFNKTIILRVLNYQIKFFIWFMALNSVAILIGYFFSLNIFKSYFFGGTRFGFQGLLLYHSEAGYIYFIAICMAYYLYLKNSNAFLGGVLLLLFVTSFIIGTKKASFLSLIFFLYFFIDNIKLLKKRGTYYFLASILIITFLFRHIIVDIFTKQFSLFVRLYSEEGFFTSFTSYRNVLLQKYFIPYINDNWGVLNYIFGGPKFANSRVELELFDLILFFGLGGIVAYVSFFKNLCTSSTKYSNFIIFSLIFASLFSGNLLSSVNTMVIMFVSVLFVNYDREQSLQK